MQRAVGAVEAAAHGRLSASRFCRIAISFLAIVGLAGCVISIGGGSWGWEREWVKETREFRFEHVGVHAVDLVGHNGSITVRGSSEREGVSLVANIRAGGRDIDSARRCLEALELSVVEEEGEVRARSRLPENRPRDWTASVSYVVEQPASVPLRARTHNGSVEIDGVTADTSLVTHNGSVKVRDGGGALSARTHNGAMNISGNQHLLELETHNGGIVARTTWTGPLAGNFVTHNGVIRLELDAVAAASIECRTHNGTIRATGAFHEQERRRGYLRATHGDGHKAGVLRFRTHNGGIRLRDFDGASF